MSKLKFTQEAKCVKSDADYGTPQVHFVSCHHYCLRWWQHFDFQDGTLTAARGRKAHQAISREVVELCEVKLAWNDDMKIIYYINPLSRSSTSAARLWVRMEKIKGFSSVTSSTYTTAFQTRYVKLTLVALKSPFKNDPPPSKMFTQSNFPYASYVLISIHRKYSLHLIFAFSLPNTRPLIGRPL